MADVKISSVLGSIEKYKFNPVMIIRTSLEAMSLASDGTINIVDPSNPFVLAIENSAVNTAAFMQQNEATTRRLYPAAALTQEDLYLHMSDKDYIDRFALPTNAVFTLLLSKEELLNSLILDATTGIRKITIPRNTYFSVAGINFSIQYPIDIRLLINGKLQAVYIVDKISPLLTLDSNLIDIEEVTDPTGLTFIKLNLNTTQFDIVSKFNDVSASSGFKTDIVIQDSFYYARVFVQDQFSNFNEIQTTHTQQIYDPFTPTAVITVLDKLIRVVIPIIYTSTNLVRGKIRIDIYQTKGTLNLLLGNYNLDDFSANWINIDSNDDNVFNQPIRNFRTLAKYSTSSVTGGRDQLSFTDLRYRVIKNAVGPQSLPITNAQLISQLENNDYTVVKNIDTLTNRIFLATRSLPSPIDNRLVTSASTNMSAVTLTLKSAIACYGVIDNGSSITLTPDVIYQNNNGITIPLTTDKYNTLVALPILQRVTEVTNGNYFYSPFHYVLDTTANTFEVRPYYLDDPVIESKSFVAENATTNLQVSVDANYSIAKTPTGYTLNILTRSSDEFKAIDDLNIYVQLSFKSKDESTRSYLLGTLVGRDTVTNERLYQFQIDSTFNLDIDDYITLTSFTDFASGIVIKSNLLQDMDIYFAAIVPAGQNYRPNSIDNELGKFQIPANALGITHERIKIRFGYSLKTLWARSRSVVNSTPYKTYNTNIAATYKKDLYELDPITGSAFSFSPTGEIVYNILHRQGDPILNTNGQPVYENLKGEIVYDQDNNPIPVDGFEKDLVRQLDIFTIEGAYYFATDQAVSTYKQSAIKTLISWLTIDLVRFNSLILDKTRIYYYPKVTLGDITVFTVNGATDTIPAGQSIKIKLSVPLITFNDDNLIRVLTRSTIKVIDEQLKNSTIATSAIEYALRNVYGVDVIDVELTPLGGAQKYSTFSVVDNSTRCSIRKKLAALPDNSLVVQEDVEISIVLHDAGNTN